MRQGGEKLLETPSICSDWLDAEDAQCHEDRLSRLDWLVKHTPDGKFRVFPGGFLAKSHFDEMRYCYIYGQFLATTILGVAFLEITLAALFFQAGHNDLERASITDLFKEAHKHHLITDREYEHLNGIRKTRNAYAHFRKHGHKESVERRAIEDERAFYGIVEEDATIVMKAVLRMVEKIAI